jgi:four helix bundle protein
MERGREETKKIKQKIKQKIKTKTKKDPCRRCGKNCRLQRSWPRILGKARRRGVAYHVQRLTRVDLPQQPPYEIGERTFVFAAAIVGFCTRLQRRGWAERHIAGQLLRCGTSVGANVQEAQAPASVRDFSSRAGIALRECREAHFWLRLVAACGFMTVPDVDPLRQESRELIAILTTLVKRTRRRAIAHRYSGVSFLFSFLFFFFIFSFCFLFDFDLLNTGRELRLRL